MPIGDGELGQPRMSSTDERRWSRGASHASIPPVVLQVSAAIAGSRDGGHMKENAAAASLDLSNVLSEIEQLIPLGPTFAQSAPTP